MMKYVFYAIPILFVIYTLVILVNRWLVKSGVPIKALFAEESSSETYIPSRKENIKVFVGSVLFRVVVFVFSALIFYTMSSEEVTQFNLNDVVETWKRWDSMSYLRISNGYTSYVEQGDYVTIVFFPLYPLFIRLLCTVVKNQVLSGILVSSFCYSLACVYLYDLVCLDYGKKVAKNAVVLLSIFPFSFFFGGVMSESTFLLFSVMSLYYIRKHQWFKASVCGYLTALSRMMGFILIIPAAIEICEEYHFFEHIKDTRYLFKTIFPKFLTILIIPMGTVVFLWINYYITGDFLYFLKIDPKWYGQSYNHFFMILDSLKGYIEYFDFRMKFAMWIPYLCIVLLAYLVLIQAVRKHRTMYSVYLLGFILVNTSLSWPLSIGRYFTCAVPLFIFLAQLLEKKPNLRNYLIVTESILFGITLTEFFVYGGIC